MRGPTSNDSSAKQLRLPPTFPLPLDESERPYFLWWTELSIADFRKKLASNDATQKAYWMGALLREANSRDVWLFVTPEEVREIWPLLVRHLGKSRAMWAWILGLPDIAWPPRDLSGAF